jgi:hypothetical protein
VDPVPDKGLTEERGKEFLERLKDTEKRVAIETSKIQKENQSINRKI